MVKGKKSGAKRRSVRKPGVKKIGAKKSVVRKVAAQSEEDVDVFTTPIGDLTLDQLIAAHVLNENSKPPHVTFPVQLSDTDVARIGAAVVALLRPPED
jgi:hypothetical protein